MIIVTGPCSGTFDTINVFKNINNIKFKNLKRDISSCSDVKNFRKFIKSKKVKIDDLINNI